MEEVEVIAALAALAQPTRLGVFRLLAKHEPDGLPAREIARELAVPHNTMSTHLAVLTRAGLIGAERQSRTIIYRARLEALREAVLFLVKDCCGGNPELCAPLIDDLTPCCSPSDVRARKKEKQG
jgi:ArsR family transcriptional regulator, arsenate/arsenite/antimonite-responsive transcriptional repressor